MKRSKLWLIAGIFFLLSVTFEAYRSLVLQIDAWQQFNRPFSDFLSTQLALTISVIVVVTLPYILLAWFCFSNYQNRQMNTLLLVACILQILNDIYGMIVAYRFITFLTILELLFHILLILLAYRPNKPLAWIGIAIALFLFVTTLNAVISQLAMYPESSNEVHDILLHLTLVRLPLFSFNDLLLWCSLALPLLRNTEEEAPAE